jgi:hypothetical protein
MKLLGGFTSAPRSTGFLEKSKGLKPWEVSRSNAEGFYGLAFRRKAYTGYAYAGRPTVVLESAFVIRTRKGLGRTQAVARAVP